MTKDLLIDWRSNTNG